MSAGSKAWQASKVGVRFTASKACQQLAGSKACQQLVKQVGNHVSS
jgi:hypothetical protein